MHNSFANKYTIVQYRKFANILLILYLQMIYPSDICDITAQQMSNKNRMYKIYVSI